MKNATALLVAALGAILAFAVTAHPSFVNLHVVGWVLILTGIIGVCIPKRGYGWMRRRLTLDNRMGRSADAIITEKKFSPILMPGGIVSESQDGVPPLDAPVTEEGVEEFIEE
jgi:hypothetical protein